MEDASQIEDMNGNAEESRMWAWERLSPKTGRRLPPITKLILSYASSTGVPMGAIVEGELYPPSVPSISELRLPPSLNSGILTLARGNGSN